MNDYNHSFRQNQLYIRVVAKTTFFLERRPPRQSVPILLKHCSTNFFYSKKKCLGVAQRLYNRRRQRSGPRANPHPNIATLN